MNKFEDKYFELDLKKRKEVISKLYSLNVDELEAMQVDFSEREHLELMLSNISTQAEKRELIDRHDSEHFRAKKRRIIQLENKLKVDRELSVLFQLAEVNNTMNIAKELIDNDYISEENESLVLLRIKEIMELYLYESKANNKDPDGNPPLWYRIRTDDSFVSKLAHLDRRARENQQVIEYFNVYDYTSSELTSSELLDLILFPEY